MNIPKSLRVAMAYKGINQSELAKKASLSTTTISFIINGKSSVNADRLERICNALGYKTSEFIALGEE